MSVRLGVESKTIRSISLVSCQRRDNFGGIPDSENNIGAKYSAKFLNVSALYVEMLSNVYGTIPHVEGNQRGADFNAIDML